MKKPKVGQIVYRLNPETSELTPVKVTRIGRKYIFCQISTSRNEEAFSLESGFKKDWPYNIKIYESQQTWKDEKEIKTINNYLGDCFKYGNNLNNLNLNQLRKIKAIIEEGKETN